MSEKVEKCLYCRKMAVKVNRLESICAQAYQLAGVCGAPLRVMNRLSAAANGDPGKRSFLPIRDEDLEIGREKIVLKAEISHLKSQLAEYEGLRDQMNWQSEQDAQALYEREEEISRLTARVERLEGALERIIALKNHFEAGDTKYPETALNNIAGIALAALEAQDEATDRE